MIFTWFAITVSSLELTRGLWCPVGGCIGSQFSGLSPGSQTAFTFDLKPNHMWKALNENTVECWMLPSECDGVKPLWSSVCFLLILSECHRRRRFWIPLIKDPRHLQVDLWPRPQEVPLTTTGGPEAGLERMLDPHPDRGRSESLVFFSFYVFVTGLIDR